MRPLFKVAHDKVWVELTSSLRGKGSQNSQQALRNDGSGMSLSTEHLGTSPNGTLSGHQEKTEGEEAVSTNMVA